MHTIPIYTHLPACHPPDACLFASACLSPFATCRLPSRHARLLICACARQYVRKASRRAKEAKSHEARDAR